MKFYPFVLNRDNEMVPAEISQMTQDDARITTQIPKWQTNWESSFISQSRLEKYAVRINGELIALGAYKIQKNSLVVHVVYIESQPESNPTMTGDRKYIGIGKLLIAYGIKLSIDNGFAGDVVLEAKTPQLAEHYKKDFGAVALPSFGSVPRFLIADEAAKDIFFAYLL